MLTLYNIPISGNCHKVRLLLNLLALPYQLYDLDLGQSEQKQAEFIRLNPFGLVPVLDDDGVIIRDSQAILIYLATRYGNSFWLPTDPILAAHIQSWLSTTANEIQHGPASLRLHYKLGLDIDLNRARETSDKVLTIMEHHLKQQQWLVGTHTTIADIAAYPYIALAHEGKVDLAPYPHILLWLRRIESLPHYVSMAGINLQDH